MANVCTHPTATRHHCSPTGSTYNKSYLTLFFLSKGDFCPPNVCQEVPPPSPPLRVHSLTRRDRDFFTIRSSTRTDVLRRRRRRRSTPKKNLPSRSAAFDSTVLLYVRHSVVRLTHEFTLIFASLPPALHRCFAASFFLLCSFRARPTVQQQA